MILLLIMELIAFVALIALFVLCAVSDDQESVDLMPWLILSITILAGAIGFTGDAVLS